MLFAHKTVVAREVFAREPLAHESNMISADVLVRDQHVRRLRRRHDLLEQQIRLRDLEARGERPVGADALGLQAAAGVRIGDGRVLEAAWRDESPQPGNGLRHDLQHAHDAVVRVFRSRGRHAHTEAAHVDLDGLGIRHDVVNHLARQDDARVGAGLAVRLDHMLPDEAGRTGDAVHIEEDQRLARMDTDALIERAVTVGIHAVHTQKPAVLGIEDAQLAALGILEALERAGHIIGNGVDLAALAKRHVIFFARDRVRTDEQAVVLFAVEVLEHFALAAAGRALVHEHDLALIRRLDHGRACVAADPALLLADVEQQRENALFGAGARIEVVGPDLVHLLGAVVHDDLLAVKVRVAERGRNEDDGAGLIVLRHIDNARKALHVRQRQREERGIERADHQARIAVAARAGGKRQHDDLLRGEPVERLLTKGRKLVAKAVLKARLVGGQIVADGHAVRVAAAHVVFHEVDDAAVLAAHDLRFLDRAIALDGVDHVVAGGVRGAVGHLLELFLRLGIGNALALFECCGDLGG